MEHTIESNNKRIVIISGGDVNEQLLQYIEVSDYIIGADRGALTLIEHGYVPDLALGDFDSVQEEQLARIKQVSKYYNSCDPIDKNYTDTELALQHALSMNPRSILLIGATGTRMDHTLANIHLLRIALDKQVPMTIIDQHNRIQLLDSQLVIQQEGYKYVSLLPLTLEVHGIELEGFAYPLHQATLTIGQSLGISNILVEQTGKISITEGLLLVIASKD